MAARYPKVTIRSLNTAPATYQIEKIVGGVTLMSATDYPFTVGAIINQTQAYNISKKYLTTTLMPKGG